MRPGLSVFCASRESSPIINEEVSMVGRDLAQAGFDLVYGGEDLGLMKKVALGFKNGGASITGVLPEYWRTEDHHNNTLDELIVVKALTDRKRKMFELSQAVLVLPGGLGTLDEAIEAIVLKSCGEIEHPIVFYNYLNFWDSFFVFVDELVERGLVDSKYDQNIKICETREELVSYLTQRVLG